VRRVLEQLEQAHGGATELIGGPQPEKQMTPTILGTKDVKDADGEES
jgi:hypothetical protein